MELILKLELEQYNQVPRKTPNFLSHTPQKGKEKSNFLFATREPYFKRYFLTIKQLVPFPVKEAHHWDPGSYTIKPTIIMPKRFNRSETHITKKIAICLALN